MVKLWGEIREKAINEPEACGFFNVIFLYSVKSLI